MYKSLLKWCIHKAAVQSVISTNSAGEKVIGTPKSFNMYREDVIQNIEQKDGTVVVSTITLYSEELDDLVDTDVILLDGKEYDIKHFSKMYNGKTLKSAAQVVYL